MKIEPAHYRYRSVSPFKDKDGMCNVSDKWTLIDKHGQRDAHSAMCGMQAEPLYTEAQLRQLGEACAAVCERTPKMQAYGNNRAVQDECAAAIRELIKELLP